MAGRPRKANKFVKSQQGKSIFINFTEINRTSKKMKLTFSKVETLISENLVINIILNYNLIIKDIYEVIYEVFSIFK